MIDKHEQAFKRMAARRELRPGSDNYIIDAESGLLSRATVWLHGDVWFFDHYEKSHPRYGEEYQYAATQRSTLWRPRPDTLPK